MILIPDRAAWIVKLNDDGLARIVRMQEDGSDQIIATGVKIADAVQIGHEHYFTGEVCREVQSPGSGTRFVVFVRALIGKWRRACEHIDLTAPPSQSVN